MSRNVVAALLISIKRKFRFFMQYLKKTQREQSLMIENGAMVYEDRMDSNPFTPTDLYGMFQIKVWTIPF